MNKTTAADVRAAAEWVAHCEMVYGMTGTESDHRMWREAWEALRTTRERYLAR